MTLTSLMLAVVTLLPLQPNAVTVNTCQAHIYGRPSTGQMRIGWTVKETNSTGRPIQKTRLRMDLLDQAQEDIVLLADLDSSGVRPVAGVPYHGKWTKAPWPMGLQSVRCTVLGVLFTGDPQPYGNPAALDDLSKLH